MNFTGEWHWLQPFEFKPGQSGNPRGRPKNPLTDALRHRLAEIVPGDPKKRTWATVAARALINEAAKGKVQAFSEIADRVEGKAMQGVHLSGLGGGAIPITSLSPEENEARIAQLLAQAGMAMVPIRGTES